jgi:hypothetical protein
MSVQRDDVKDVLDAQIADEPPAVEHHRPP